MHPTLRNILVTILGLVIGMLVNGTLINAGTNIFPYPESVDPNNFEHLKEVFKDAPMKYYIFPFLAHALGTLVAAFVACKLAVSEFKKITLVIGGLFIVGGLMANYLIQGPIWFIAADLLLAYIPFAFAGKKLAGK